MQYYTTTFLIYRFYVIVASIFIWKASSLLFFFETCTFLGHKEWIVLVMDLKGYLTFWYKGSWYIIKCSYFYLGLNSNSSWILLSFSTTASWSLSTLLLRWCDFSFRWRLFITGLIWFSVSYEWINVVALHMNEFYFLEIAAFLITSQKS